MFFSNPSGCSEKKLEVGGMGGDFCGNMSGGCGQFG